MNTKRVLTAIMSSGLLLACASAPAEPETLQQALAKRGYVIGDPVERLHDYRINGWNSVDRTHVILTVGASDRYLVSLRNPCDGLRSAEHLAFTTTVGKLTKFDKLFVRDPGGFVETCLVDTMHELKRAPSNA